MQFVSIIIVLWLYLVRSLKRLVQDTLKGWGNVREGGEIGLFITLVPKVLWLRFLIRWLNNFGDLHWKLIGWMVNSAKCQTFQQLFVIYRRGNFVNYNWGCTLIYRSLSYPFRSLQRNITWGFKRSHHKNISIHTGQMIKATLIV